MARRSKTQHLINRINTARASAGLMPTSTTSDTLTLQQVEAQADSLHIKPEALLIQPRDAA